MKQKTGRKLLSFLLTLAMLVGLMPGMGLTAYAADGDLTITDLVTAIGNGEFKYSDDVFIKVSDGEVHWFIRGRDCGAGTLTYDTSNSRYCLSFGGDKYEIVLDAENYITCLNGIGGQAAGYTYNGKSDHPFGSTAGTITVDSVTLPNTATVTVDDKVALTATVAPDDATDKTVKWSVGGTNAGAVKLFTDEACTTEVGIAATDKLTVYAKGISAGSATVTVTTNDGNKTDNCSVTVNPVTYPVTYKVVNGTWSDGSTTDKKETVADGSKPASVPTGMKASEGYTGGAWDTNPADATITGATTFTYTFTAKQAATVTKVPVAKPLIYTGSAQELVTAGTASGGTMQYAIGTKDAATQTYTTSIPTGTNAGTYYVWYKAVGDSNHADSEPGCVTVTINEASKPQTETEPSQDGQPQTKQPQTKQTKQSQEKKSQAEKITISKAPKIKKPKVKKNKVTVSWKKIKKNKKGKKLLKKIKKIQIQVSTDPQFKQIVKDKKVGRKKTKVKLKLKRKTTYYVRVRYVGKDGVSRWSKVKKVKTK